MIVHRSRVLILILSIVAVGLVVIGCGGPQRLEVAIRPDHQRGYTQALGDLPQTPREAFFAWKSADTGRAIPDLAAADAALSQTENPFDARRDPAAVSRGAVLYAAHCATCHGEKADGRGVAMPYPLKKMDFHRFANRFAVTVHRGAPENWYRKIRDGYTSAQENPDGTQSSMPPFDEALAREQIWLTITYLQSLDRDAVNPADDRGDRR